MTVFMEARVNVRPLTNATMDRFVDHYSDVEHPILERNGYDLVGAWKATGGPLGQVIHLYRFDTISALDLSRTSLLGDPDLLTIYQSAMSVLDGAAMREFVRIGGAAALGLEGRLDELLGETQGGPRQFVAATSRIVFGRQAEAYDLVAQIVKEHEAIGAFKFVTGYDTIFGERGEWTAIGIFPNGVPPMAFTSGVPDPEHRRRLREIMPEESMMLLNAMPYSPLQ